MGQGKLENYIQAGMPTRQKNLPNFAKPLATFLWKVLKMR